MNVLHIVVLCICVLSIIMIFIFIMLNLKNIYLMSKSRYFRIRLFVVCGKVNPLCVYDNVHTYTCLYSAKRAARSMALEIYPPASWLVDEVAKR